ARAAGRAGDRAARQLLQPGALRLPDDPPVEPADRPGPPTQPKTRLPRRHAVPPDLPLRARVEPRDGRAAGLPRPTPEAASRTRVLALRGALHAGSRVDRDAAHRRGRDGARLASERLDVDPRAAARP